MKRYLKIFGAIFIFGALPFLWTNWTNRNTKSINMKDCVEADVRAFSELDALIKEGDSDSEFYEVMVYGDGPCFLANYNIEHQVLHVANDPTSGWSGFYEASPADLRKICTEKIRYENWFKHLKTLPSNRMVNFPTRWGG